MKKPLTNGCRILCCLAIVAVVFGLVALNMVPARVQTTLKSPKVATLNECYTAGLLVGNSSIKLGDHIQSQEFKQLHSVKDQSGKTLLCFTSNSNGYRLYCDPVTYTVVRIDVIGAARTLDFLYVKELRSSMQETYPDLNVAARNNINLVMTNGIEQVSISNGRISKIIMYS